MNKEYSLRMADFSNIKVSTQTYIIHSNLHKVDLPEVLENIQLEIPYEDISEDYDDSDEYDGVTFPRIISASYKGKERGKARRRKIRTPRNESGKNFLNCVSLTVQLDPRKNINVKLFHNGVFQLTGCKCYEHAQKSLVVIWSTLEKIANVFEFKKNTDFPSTYMQAYIVSAMRNVDFRLGFDIDREALSKHITNNTPYKIVPIIESFMGVQLSIPIESVADMLIHKVSFVPGEDLSDEIVRYDELWEVKPDVKSKVVKAKKQKAITIAVFQTGQVLMSGIDEMYQTPVFEWFINEISKIQDEIKVKAPEEKTFIEYIPKKRRSKFHFKTIFE